MRALLLPFLICCSWNVTAQTISGAVAANGEAFAKATVALCRARDSAVVRYTTSNAEGKFLFEKADSGSYLVSVTATSFAPYYSQPFTVGNEAVALPAIQLQPVSSTLAGVQVVSKKPVIEVLPDKTVFNVEGSINAVGSTALELLQKSPGVLVDQNDAITVQGKTGVRIYIDGRPSPLGPQDLAQYLRSLTAADIEAIEIITNPSARFEAAGNAGIINIRLKKNKAFGTNATVNGGWSVGIFPKYNGSLSFNHRNKRWNFFGSYGYNRFLNQSELNLFRFQADSIFDQQSTTIIRGGSHNIKAGADYFLDKTQTLGILINSNISQNDAATVSSTPIGAQRGGGTVRTLLAQTVSDRSRYNYSANINYRKQTTGNKILSADADYAWFDLDGNAFIPNQFIRKDGSIENEIVFGNNTPVRISMLSGKIDWEQPFQKGKLAAGLRSQVVQTANTFDFFNYIGAQKSLDANRSNSFDFTEAIHAAYVQYQRSVKKWNYNIGLRAEQTESRGLLTTAAISSDKDVRRVYLNFFPSGGVTVQLPKQQSLAFNFSRRIDRPSYQDLNPFENRLDELTYQKGNPFLRPQYTNTVELRHSYKYKLNTSLSYSVVEDMFASITDTTEGRRNFIMQRNLARQRIINFNVSLPFTVTRWWSGFANASVNRNRYKAVFEQAKTIDLTVVTANLYAQNTVTINKRWTAEVSGFYVSPYIWAGTYECRAIGSLDAGVAVKIFKDAGLLKLSGSDLLFTMPWQGVSRFGGLLINANGRWESRLLRLNFTYKFGNAQVKAARQRSTGLDDLNKRVQ